MLIFLQEKDQKYVFASLVRLHPFLLPCFSVRDPWYVFLSKASRCLLNSFVFLLITVLFVEQAPFFVIGKHVFFPHLPHSCWFLQCLGIADNWPWKSACHSIHVLIFRLCKLKQWSGGKGSNGITQTLQKQILAEADVLIYYEPLWGAGNTTAVNSIVKLTNKCQKNVFVMQETKTTHFWRQAS